MKKLNDCLSKKEKAYIVEDMLCSLNSTIYGVGGMQLKSVNNWQKYKFDLPASEVKTIVSIIKKLQKQNIKKVKK